jgi:hypothetical protein
VTIVYNSHGTDATPPGDVTPSYDENRPSWELEEALSHPNGKRRRRIWFFLRHQDMSPDPNSGRQSQQRHCHTITHASTTREVHDTRRSSTSCPTRSTTSSLYQRPRTTGSVLGPRTPGLDQTPHHPQVMVRPQLRLLIRGASRPTTLPSVCPSWRAVHGRTANQRSHTREKLDLRSTDVPDPPERLQYGKTPTFARLAISCARRSRSALLAQATVENLPPSACGGTLWSI